MTQRDFKDWPIDPNQTSGVDLAEVLNSAIEADNTNHLASSRPSYLAPGGIWSKGSGDSGAIDLYLWDGVKDVLIGGSGNADGGMVIADAPPAEPSIGDMWLRTPSMIVFVWNGDYWFQFPEHLGGAGGGGGGNIASGLEAGQMVYWDGSVWVPTSAARIHQSGGGPFFDVSGELHIHPQGDAYRKTPWGGLFRSEVFPDFPDQFLGQRVDWNMVWFRPNDDNTNQKRLNGFDIYADRFQVRLSPAPLDDPWDDQEIVLKCDGRDVHIGVRDYRAKVHAYGDFYCGMSQNFYGKVIPSNPDTRPGTQFSGGICCIGSYIDGEPLDPVNQEERDNPSLIRQRAFSLDSGIDLTLNPIYNVPDPDEPRWAGIRDSMPPTMKWLKDNSLVADPDGVIRYSGSTQFGNSNDDEHQFMGDVYCGYVGDSLPDTGAGDRVPGTLFLARGLKLVGEGNFDPSIHCNGNHIIQVKAAAADDHAPNWGQVRNLNRNIKQAMADAIQRSDDFESLKTNLLNALNDID